MVTEAGDGHRAWPDSTTLRAAGHSLDLAPEGVRHHRVDGVEVLQGLYAAVRAADWSSLLTTVTSERRTTRADGAVEVVREEDVGGRFDGRLVLVLDGRGVLEATVELRARADAEVNRWGLNACLDADGYAGAVVALDDAPDVGTDAFRVPVDVAAQRSVDGVLQGLFPPSARMVLHRTDGAVVTLASEGLLLEAEDQRNWTDPSTKVYGGSLREPRPITVAAGQVLRQRLTVSAVVPGTHAVTRHPRRGAGTGPQAALERHRVGTASSRGRGAVVGQVRPLPRVGVQVNDVPAGTTGEPGRLRELLAALRVDHARVDLEPAADPAPTADPEPSSGWAAPDLGLPLELAVLLADTSQPALRAVARAADALPEGSRVLVHLAGRRTTDRRLADAVAALATRPVDVVPGSDAYFTDLNRDRPDCAGGTVSFTVTPTVHRDEDEAVFATLPVQRLLVEEARRLLGAGVVVSPVTLRLRGAPESAPQDRAARRVITPAHVDGRLRALRGAAWTVGSVHAVTAGGAVSGTWHELLGPRGLVAEDGAVSPAFHALAALRATTRPRVAAVASPDGSVVGLHAVDDARLLVAGLRPWGTAVDLTGVLPPEGAVRRRLREQDLAAAAAELDWWAVAPSAAVGPVVELEPFEVTSLTWQR